MTWIGLKFFNAALMILGRALILCCKCPMKGCVSYTWKFPLKTNINKIQNSTQKEFLQGTESLWKFWGKFFLKSSLAVCCGYYKETGWLQAGSSLSRDFFEVCQDLTLGRFSFYLCTNPLIILFSLSLLFSWPWLTIS